MVAQAEQQTAKIAALDQQIAQKDAEARDHRRDHRQARGGAADGAADAPTSAKGDQDRVRQSHRHLEAQLQLIEQRRSWSCSSAARVEVDGGARGARGAARAGRRRISPRHRDAIWRRPSRRLRSFAEDLVKAEQRTRLQVLTAPVDGIVQQLAMHTVGGVVTPAQALMVVVPAESQLEIEAMVSNRDIGFVQAGQDAEIKIDTFNFTRYGLLHGKVLSVSQDAIMPREAAGQARATSRRARRRHAASRRARSWSTRRASRSTARRCRSRTSWSISRPAWRSRSRSRPARGRVIELSAVAAAALQAGEPAGAIIIG